MSGPCAERPFLPFDIGLLGVLKGLDEAPKRGLATNSFEEQTTPILETDSA